MQIKRLKKGVIVISEILSLGKNNKAF